MSDIPNPYATPLGDLLDRPPAVINVGLEGFSDELRQQDVECVHVDWAPPAGGDPELARLLSKLGS
jgi:hypothetical protein